MKTKFLKIKDYLLLLDLTTKPKLGDWVSDQYEIPDVPFKLDEEYFRIGYEADLIVAHLPLNNAPILEGVDFLPEIEYFKILASDGSKQLCHSLDVTKAESLVVGFEEGYKAAQSKQYSKEDMINAFNMGQSTYKESFLHKNGEERRRETKEKFIQSLSTQQLPIDFVPSFGLKRIITGYCPGGEVEGTYVEDKNKLKTIVNSQGQRVVQGEYKFD